MGFLQSSVKAMDVVVTEMEASWGSETSAVSSGTGRGYARGKQGGRGGARGINPTSIEILPGSS